MWNMKSSKDLEKEALITGDFFFFSFLEMSFIFNST